MSKLASKYHQKLIDCIGIIVICASALVLVGLLTLPAQAAPFAYVANSGSDDVTVVDVETPSVITTVPVGISPYGVATNPAGGFVYVTNRVSDSVTVISTANNTVTSTVNLPAGADPHMIVVNQAGTRAYTTNAGLGTVSVINLTANPPAVMATISVGDDPKYAAISPNGERVYVSRTLGNAVSVIDATSNTVIDNLSIFQPYGIAVHPSSPIFYVAGEYDSSFNRDPGLHIYNVSDNSYYGYAIFINTSGAAQYLSINGDGSSMMANGWAEVLMKTNDLLPWFSPGEYTYPQLTGSWSGFGVGASFHPVDYYKGYIVSSTFNRLTFLDLYDFHNSTSYIYPLLGHVTVGTNPISLGNFISPLVAVVPASTILADATVGQPYSHNMSATGGPPPFTWSISGAPWWLSIDPNTGVLSGVPPVGSAGVVSFSVTETDGTQAPGPVTSTQALSLNVLPAAGGGTAAAATPVPGLGEWALMLLAAALAGVIGLRKRRTSQI